VEIREQKCMRGGRRGGRKVAGSERNREKL